MEKIFNLPIRINNQFLLLNKFIKKYNLIIFDFDGVIKNSLEVKSKAFERLFESYGKLITKKIKAHHKKNEGLSRYKKIPIYLSL